MLPHDQTAPLDPADWEEFRALGKRIIDDMADYMTGIRDRPVWQAVPQDVRDSLTSGLLSGPFPASPAKSGRKHTGERSLRRRLQNGTRFAVRARDTDPRGRIAYAYNIAVVSLSEWR